MHWLSVWQFYLGKTSEWLNDLLNSNLATVDTKVWVGDDSGLAVGDNFDGEEYEVQYVECGTVGEWLDDLTG